MEKSLEELKEQIISAWGMVHTAHDHDFLVRLLDTRAGSFAQFRSEEFWPTLDELIREGRIEVKEELGRGAPRKLYIKRFDTLEVMEHSRRLRKALDSMTDDDWAWLSGTGRYAQ